LSAGGQFHLKVRLEQDTICLLVILGVRADGTKELVALADGVRESAESWADLLRSCRRRGMRAPVQAVGDGALGFSEGLPGRVARDPGAAVLVPQVGQRAGVVAEIGPPVSESSDRGDHQRGVRRARP
jgi:hypothetical protein